MHEGTGRWPANHCGEGEGQDQLTCTRPSLPGLEIVIRPPQAHTAWQPLCKAGCPPTLTRVAPGVHGVLTAGVHGAGVKAPDLAAVAAATAGLAIAPHIPNDGMLVSGT